MPIPRTLVPITKSGNATLTESELFYQEAIIVATGAITLTLPTPHAEMVALGPALILATNGAVTLASTGNWNGGGDSYTLADLSYVQVEVVPTTAITYAWSIVGATEIVADLAETVRDTIAAAFAAGSHTNCTITVSDGGDSISVAVAAAVTLASTEPGAVSSSTSGAVGTGSSAARNDHAHDLGAHAHTGATDGGTVAYSSLTGTPSVAALSDSEPAAVATSTSGTAGVATTASRSDHGHDLSTHAHSGATNGGQVAYSALSGAPTIPALSDAEPPSVSSSTSGAVGDAATSARGNHSHDLGTHAHTGSTDGGQVAYSALSGAPTIPSASDAEPGAVSSSTSGSAGVGAAFSRNDHAHDLGDHTHAAGAGAQLTLAVAHSDYTAPSSWTWVPAWDTTPDGLTITAKRVIIGKLCQWWLHLISSDPGAGGSLASFGFPADMQPADIGSGTIHFPVIGFHRKDTGSADTWTTMQGRLDVTAAAGADRKVYLKNAVAFADNEVTELFLSGSHYIS